MGHLLVAGGCRICGGEGQQAHPRCARCTILISPGHDEVAGHRINGRLLCSDCLPRVGSKCPTLAEAIRGRDSLFEYWSAGASSDDIANSRLISAGVIKTRHRKRL